MIVCIQEQIHAMRGYLFVCDANSLPTHTNSTFNGQKMCCNIVIFVSFIFLVYSDSMLRTMEKLCLCLF